MSETTVVKGQYGLVQSGGTGKKLKTKTLLLQMSSFLTPSLYSKNGLENQFINCVWNTHDLMCGCNDCFGHLKAILQRKETQPCLPSTEDTGTAAQDNHGEDDDGFKEGDLENLFASDFEEDDG